MTLVVELNGTGLIYGIQFSIFWILADLKIIQLLLCIGKSFSGALILESINPQYDERLFIEFDEKYKFTTCCVQNLFVFCFCFDIQNSTCTQHLFFL